MKVYVVIGIWRYESSSIMGVYSTYEKANERKNILDADKFGFDEVKINEILIDEDINDI
jgi:hypothetical protein